VSKKVQKTQVFTLFAAESGLHFQ